MSDTPSDTPKPKRVDTRTPEEIATAQRALLHILAVAAAFPVIWVSVLAWDISQTLDQIKPADEYFALFMATWGLLSSVVWVGCNGYTLFQVKRGNMEAGRYLPVVPVLWVFFWFTALFMN